MCIARTFLKIWPCTRWALDEHWVCIRWELCEYCSEKQPAFFAWVSLNDLLYLPLNSSLVNYADDNHICHDSVNLELLKDHIENDALMAMNCFNRNQTTANADKFQSILLSRGSTGDFRVNVGGHDLHRDNTLKILGVTLDDKLNFKTHIQNICQKASRQINALIRISKFLNKQCRMHVYKSFVCANFNYCPVVWMFCGKTNRENWRKSKKEHFR